MSNDSTPATTPGKAKPKTRKKFPLGIHKGSGQWTKKVRGVCHYFGKVADDPDGERALDRWMDEKDDLQNGRVPRPKTDSLTLVELRNEYLESKDQAVKTGELTLRSFRSYHDSCERLLKILGKNRVVADITAADLRALRTKLSKGRGLVALGNELTKIRSVFIFAFDEHQIAVPYKALKKPKPKAVRSAQQSHETEHGSRMLESHEIRQILDEVKQPLKSMILLGINGGLGNTDLSSVPMRAFDLDAGWLNFPRPKTAVPRRIPLWPETIQAIREWLDMRPTAKHADDQQLMFLTCRGARWVSVSKNGTTKDAIIQEFNKVLKKLNLKRKRLSFYCLRHGFQTIGSETTDEVAVSSVMGHTDLSMAARYRERLNDDRLQKVVNHVRSWLFPPDTDSTDTDTDTEPDTNTDTNEAPVPALRLFAG